MQHARVERPQQWNAELPRTYTLVAELSLPKRREAKLQAYGREKDIVSTDPQTNVTMQKLEMLNRDYAGAVADRFPRRWIVWTGSGCPAG